MDFFDSEFDETTKTKLRLYAEYLRGWFPVFAYGPKYSSINIIDFFAGPGKDDEGNYGSPLLALMEAKNYTEVYKKQNRVVNFYFYNENRKATEALLNNTKPWQNENSPFKPIIIHKKFPDSLEDHIQNLMKPNDMNLIFIDQFGIKHMNKYIFQLLTRYPKNDLLFFISSSFFKRFASESEFQELFPEISKNEVDKIPQKEIHSFIAKKYQSWLPSTAFTSHFSLLKKGNVYGLIFVSHNILGLRKFLDSCWKIDTESGSNNFRDERQATLFASDKIQTFQANLRDKFEKGRMSNERILYQYTLLSGMLPRHAKEIISELYKSKIIRTNNGKPRNSDAGYKSPRNIIVQA